MNISSIKSYVAWMALAVAPLLSPHPVSAGPLKPGDVFPSLNAANLEGTVPELQGKVVLVDFFASWCAPCRVSFPVMQELHKKYGPQGLVILAVSVDEKRTDLDDFMKAHPVDFPVVRDGGHRLVAQVQVPTMPSSFLLDRTGHVVSVHRGFKGEDSRRQYISEIEALLK